MQPHLEEARLVDGLELSGLRATETEREEAVKGEPRQPRPPLWHKSVQLVPLFRPLFCRSSGLRSLSEDFVYSEAAGYPGSVTGDDPCVWARAAAARQAPCGKEQYGLDIGQSKVSPQKGVTKMSFGQIGQTTRCSAVKSR